MEKFRYKHRVSWFEDGELKTKWFTSHVKAIEFYQRQLMKDYPVYYARQVSDKLSAHMFDNIKTENGFGQRLIELDKVK